MEKHVLSKSSFVKGMQCAKQLYLYKKHPYLRDKLSPEQQAIFKRGTRVGLLAHKLFKNGIDVRPSSPSKYAASVELTQQLIREGTTAVIYEASFIAHKTLVALDVLACEDDKWIGYEVKSSARITPVYLLDAALQYFIITESGLALDDFFIVYVDTDYVRKGEIDYSKLFRKKSVLKEVLAQQDFIRENIDRLLQVVTEQEAPEVKIGSHCYSPYACDFIGNCWKGIPEDSVLHLGGTGKEELFTLFDNGITTIKDIPDLYPASKSMRFQINGVPETVQIDKEGLKKFMSTINYPLFFMDFETMMPPVPLFDDTHPYQHIPFQYSLHFKEHKNSPLVHFEFLAEAGIDPRRLFIEQLIRDTSTPGDILTYNASFERSVLTSLKTLFSEYTDAIDYIIYRIKDLMYPFEHFLYYHSSMKGSFSIKSVLPALTNDASYSKLSINSGSAAMTAFEELQQERDIFKIAETRDALSAYCALDTLAMVKIFDVLENTIKSF